LGQQLETNIFVTDYREVRSSGGGREMPDGQPKRPEM
jgi:hypothetical protein